MKLFRRSRMQKLLCSSVQRKLIIITRRRVFDDVFQDFLALLNVAFSATCNRINNNRGTVFTSSVVVSFRSLVANKVGYPVAIQ